MKKSIVVLLLLTAFIPSLFAQKTLKVWRIPSAPVIDADSSDASWRDIPWNNGFTLINQTTQKAPQETRFKAAHDNHTLYFLIEATESSPSKIRAASSGRDSNLWNDDCVEIFIDPNRDRDRFYQFIINTRGQVYDAEYLQGGILCSKEWNSPGLKVAARINRDSFTVEAAIPLVDLGLENTGGRMGLNITRESYTSGKPVLSSFVPINGGFLQPGLFAPAQLEHCDLRHFAWKVRPPYDTQIIRRNGRLLYEGKIYIANATGKLRFAVLDEKLHDGPAFRENILLDDGLGREYSFALPVDDSVPAQMLLLELKDKNSGLMYARRQVPIPVQYSPLSLTLTNPPYRDNIYSDMNVREIAGGLTIRETGAESLPVAIDLSDSSGKVIAKTSRKGSGDFRLPIPVLENGTYLLTVHAGNYTTVKKIRKLPKFKGEIRFDENKIMYVDGKKSIPYGWFSIIDLARASKLGFNVAVDYGGAYYHGKKLQEVFDKYAAAGIKAAIYCYPSNLLYKPEAQRKPLSKDEADQIRSRIRELRDHPALLGWYLCDEPDAAPALPARMKEIFEICKEEDPYHPAIILNNTVEGYRKYAESGDITMPDIYPNFIVGGDSGKPISNVYSQMKASGDVSSRIPWCTPQAFNYGDYGRSGQRAPNFTELRNMHYQALLAGTTGFCWYTFSHLDCDPEVYLGVAQLLKEAGILEDIWFNGHRRKMLPTGNAEVFAAAYPGVNGRDYLIAVNATTSSKKVSLPASGKTYYAAGEKKSFTPVNGKLSDTLEKYQARVYVTDRKLAESFSLDEYKPKVAEALKKLYKEGNLAYAPASGVQFELSWKEKNYPAWHLGDGSFTMVFRLGSKDKGTAAVTIVFPKEVKASRLRLYGLDLRSGTVEADKNGTWIKLADLKKIDDRAMEAQWPAGTFRKFRLSRLDATGISEIELY